MAGSPFLAFNGSCGRLVGINSNQGKRCCEIPRRPRFRRMGSRNGGDYRTAAMAAHQKFAHTAQRSSKHVQSV
jgi:hypothetical protein